ncbi:serine protease Do [Variovorax sp. CF079]|uniref:trypsin-like peptidase domain-containing protein n=1 Tax=Variovorax sp. CF079 TaxID=1882774 RepID=UPI0008878316|nr:trypsin-like peptidase domain-containing protein [Variovorax sp. CF079]SDE54374.1 serine protease Do [Variovorax sp. CF079]
MLSKPFARGVLAATLGALALLGTTHAWPRDGPCLDPSDAPKQGVDFVAAVARQAPAVVSVLAIGQGTEWGDNDDNGMLARSRPGSERASASGIVVSADGYVLTSAHVVLGAQETAVLVGGQRRWPADVVGLDRRTDVALLKIAATNLPVAAIGSSARLCAGEWVAALGAPFGFEQSVTAGLVSANPRFLPGGTGEPLIQTDVALNPGNSGGPLFNKRGEVVAMNSMIYSASGGYLGVSFSLPIDTAMRVAAELRSTGRVTRGQIGARTQALTSDLALAFGLDAALGALIVRVDAGGPAAKSGLRSGDVVLGVDTNTATAYPEIQQRVAAARPGASITLNIWRRKAPLTVKLTVAQSAPDLPQRVASRDGREPRLGLDLVERTAKQTGGLLEPGLYVSSTSGSAQRAGLRFGDVILAVNDVGVSGISDLDRALESVRQGETVALLIRRGSITTFVPVTPPVGLTR